MAPLNSGGAQLRDLYIVILVTGLVLLVLNYSNSSGAYVSYQRQRSHRHRHGAGLLRGKLTGEARVVGRAGTRGSSWIDEGWKVGGGVGGVPASLSLEIPRRGSGHVTGGGAIALPDVFENVADLILKTRPSDESAGAIPPGEIGYGGDNERYDILPFFWHIPRSAGTTVRDVASHCLGLVVASDAGLRGEMGPRHGSRADLYVVRSEGGKYVNVDTSTIGGLVRGRDLGLVDWMTHHEGGGGHLVVSPRIWDAAALLFDPAAAASAAAQRRRSADGDRPAAVANDNADDDEAAAARSRPSLRVKARLFAFFRHPIHRSASLFHHLRSASPTDPNYDPDLSTMEITDWAKTDAFVDNFVTRSLVNKLDPPGQFLTLGDIDVAKEILRRKVLVGIVEDKSESVRRFEHFLGWERPGFHLASSFSAPSGAALAASSSEGRDECRSKLLHWGWPNKNRHPEVEEGTEAWELLRRKNLFDLELYEYARFLFSEQGDALENGTMLTDWEVKMDQTAGGMIEREN